MIKRSFRLCCLLGNEASGSHPGWYHRRHSLPVDIGVHVPMYFVQVLLQRTTWDSQHYSTSPGMGKLCPFGWFRVCQNGQALNSSRHEYRTNRHALSSSWSWSDWTYRT